MIKRKLLLILLSFGLVFSNVFAKEIVDEKYVGSETETKENVYTDLTEEEAIQKKNELEIDNHDYKITVVIKSYSVSAGKEFITIENEFDSKDDAEKYLKDLEEKGYKVSNTNISQNETTIDVNLNEIFDTEEEAVAALKEFKETNDVLDSNTLISKIRNEKKDISISSKSTVSYDSLDKAENVKKALAKTADGYEIYGVIRKETIEKSESKVTGNVQFDTQEAALAYIEGLKKEGWNVDELKVNLLKFEESTWKDESGVVVNPGTSDGKSFNYGHLDITLITSFKNVSSTGVETTVNGMIYIGTVSVNGKSIRMSGLSQDPNSGLYEYTSASRKLEITNKSLVKITGTVVVGNSRYPFTVEGYMSESQNVCEGENDSKGFDLEFKEVTIINSKVLVDTKLINKYNVTGTVSKSPITKYYVDTVKKSYGYDYKVEATGKKTVKEDKYTLTGSASKEVYETKCALDVITETKKYEKIYGKLIVKHVDTTGKELAETVTTTEKVGTDYTTSKKEFEDYEFIKITGDAANGKYIDGTLTVTYIYEFVGGTGGDVPETGIIDNNVLEYITAFSTFTLIAAIILRKRIA